MPITTSLALLRSCTHKLGIMPSHQLSPSTGHKHTRAKLTCAMLDHHDTICLSQPTVSLDSQPCGALVPVPSLDSSLTSLAATHPQPLPSNPPRRARRASTTTSRRAKRGGTTTSSKTLRSSAMRGVTRHTRTGRFDAHIWCDGRQWYLGAFTSELLAGAAYDVAAIKMRPNELPLNLPITCYGGRIGELLQLLSQDDVMEATRYASKHRDVFCRPDVEVFAADRGAMLALLLQAFEVVHASTSMMGDWHEDGKPSLTTTTTTAANTPHSSTHVLSTPPPRRAAAVASQSKWRDDKGTAVDALFSNTTTGTCSNESGPPFLHTPGSPRQTGPKRRRASAGGGTGALMVAKGPKGPLAPVRTRKTRSSSCAPTAHGDDACMSPSSTALLVESPLAAGGTLTPLYTNTHEFNTMAAQLLPINTSVNAAPVAVTPMSTTTPLGFELQNIDLNSLACLLSSPLWSTSLAHSNTKPQQQQVQQVSTATPGAGGVGVTTPMSWGDPLWSPLANWTPTLVGGGTTNAVFGVGDGVVVDDGGEQQQDGEVGELSGVQHQDGVCVEDDPLLLYDGEIGWGRDEVLDGV